MVIRNVTITMTMTVVTVLIVEAGRGRGRGEGKPKLNRSNLVPKGLTLGGEGGCVGEFLTKQGFYYDDNRHMVMVIVIIILTSGQMRWAVDKCLLSA